MAEEFTSRVKYPDLGTAILKGRKCSVSISIKELQKTPCCGLVPFNVPLRVPLLAVK